MENNKLTPAEYLFCKYQYHAIGSFHKKLIETIMHADEENTEKLKLGFPELVDVVIKFGHVEGYWQELEKKWALRNAI